MTKIAEGKKFKAGLFSHSKYNEDQSSFCLSALPSVCIFIRSPYYHMMTAIAPCITSLPTNS